MKKNLLLTAVLIALFINALNAQTIIDFESLTVPDVGYYNGSTDYSGSGEIETFIYEIEDADFYVNYSSEYGGYWTGLAYSNQTDLETADWNNYSAYATPAGGANESSVYVFAYSYFPDSVMFDLPVSIQSVSITNSVWAYKYMTGEDGTGHEYITGDFFILSIIGINPDGSHNDSPVAFFLGQDDNITDNWTNVDLSSLGNVKGLIFSLTSSDDMTPYYYCLDNLTYTDVVSVENTVKQNISVFPNPATDYINVKGIANSNIKINDITGKIVYSKNNSSEKEQINISHLKSGVYFITIENNDEFFSKKLIVK